MVLKGPGCLLKKKKKKKKKKYHELQFFNDFGPDGSDKKKKKKKGTLSKKCIYVSLCIHTWIYLVLFFGFI